MASRPLGLKLIVAYKLVKAPLVLALAVFLTLSPRGALHVTALVERDLSEGGALLGRLARWLELHVTSKALGHAALIAWLDGLLTALEGFLLWRGHAWGEWVVIVALSALVPFEFFSLERHPSWLKLAVLLLNALIVLYLARLRLGPHPRMRAK